MKIISIIGARPQFIKAAPLSNLLRKNFDEKIIHTGQHYDFGMSEVFFNELNLPKPNYNLGIGSGLHGHQTGKMLIAIEEILIKEKPNLVIVYGDTNSTLAGALAASKIHISLAHIEAGLRSHNKLMPEEQNRIITDHLSDYLFVPSGNATENLKKENIVDNVFNVGDIMYDSILMFGRYSDKTNILSKNNLKENNYFLATIHRAENVDKPERLKQIFSSFSKLDKKIVLPIHPRTKKNITKYEIKLPKNVNLIEPVSYIEMIELIKKSEIVLTDSGGLQKDAYYLGIPCVTLRDETEWVETINSGWNKIASANEEAILNSATSFQNNNLPIRENLYGDGKTSYKILDYIDKCFS